MDDMNNMDDMNDMGDMDIMDNKVDRAGWPAGEWDNEPDFEEFIHNNLRCLIRRTYAGILCGYVIIPNEHSNYMIDSSSLGVHGEVTFDERVSILETKEFEDMGFTNIDGTRIIGFDCNHYNDLAPVRLRSRDVYSSFGFDDLSDGEYGTYRNMEYVKENVISLCDQICEKEQE